MSIGAAYLVALALSASATFGQCADTVFNELLESPKFVDMSMGISTPVVAADGSVIYIGVGLPGILVKKDRYNNNNNWAKKIEWFTPYFFDSNGDIIGVFDTNDQYLGSGRSGGIAKLSNAGEVLWAKDIGIAGEAHLPLGVHTLARGRDDDIVLYGFRNKKDISIYIFDRDVSSLKLQKQIRFHPPTAKDEDIISMRVAYADNSLFIVAVVGGVVDWKVPPSGHTRVLLMRMDYTTGEIAKIQYIQADDELLSVISHGYPVMEKGSFTSYFNLRVADNGTLIMAGRKQISYEHNSMYYGIVFDQDLSIVKYKIYNLPETYRYFSSQANEVLPFVNHAGKILYSVTRDSPTEFGGTSGCYYFLADNNLEIVSQRFLSNEATGGLSHRVTSVPVLKDNNDIQLIFQSFGVPWLSPVSFINIPNNTGQLPCRGEESSFLTVEEGSFSTVPLPYLEQRPTVRADIRSSTALKPEPADLESERFCVQENICNAIKIISEADFCVVGDTAVFSIKKNRQCLYKTRWITDSRYVAVTAQNDTTLRLRLLKPFSGYIKAGFEDCDLADSIFVTVHAPLKKFSLGANFTLCPDSQYVLRATGGYQDYLWQNNTRADSLVVSKAGAYSVTASDYCGRKYADTIIASAIDIPLLSPMGGEICKFDTLHVSLNESFTNYNWQKAEPIAREGTTLHFSPQQTAAYIVSGDPFPGCTVSAAIRVIVKDCPRGIAFPNAFSPNNDRLNDVFAVVTAGNVQTFHLKVYNRYGQLVFQSTDFKNGWDGYFKGEPQPAGSYIWTCAYSFKGEAAKAVSGTLLLVR